MRNVIVFPAAGDAAKENYSKTVANTVEINRLRAEMSTQTAQNLENHYPDGRVRIWGTRSSNRAEFGKINPGDVVFFYGNYSMYAVGTVGVVFEDRRLAKQLWGDGEATWELMVTIDEWTENYFPLEAFNRISGRSDRKFQKIRVLTPENDADGVEAILNALGLANPPGKDRSDKVSDPELFFEGQTDSRQWVSVRREQRFLRATLLEGRKAAECVFCGKLYPSNLLNVAHIKRRREATESERTDWGHIAVLACVLGCDALYEHGYISVNENGKVIGAPSSRNDMTKDLTNKVNAVVGREVGVDLRGREKYFAWHRENLFSPNC